MKALNRKKITVVAALIVGVTLFVLTLSAQARPLAEIKSSGEIRMCLYGEDMTEDRPYQSGVTPAGCRDDCTFTGPMSEVAQAFAETLGPDIKAHLLRVGWDEQFHNAEGKTERDAAYTPKLLASGACDIYANGMLAAEWRQNKMDFVTIKPTRSVVLTHKSRQADFKSPPDLASKTAITFQGSAYNVWFEEQNKSVYASDPIQLKYLEPGSGETALYDAVDKGDVDFIIMPAEDAMFQSQHVFKELVPAFAVGDPATVNWAFRKEDKELQTMVQAFFDAQRDDPDSAMNAIWKKHYGMSLSESIEMATQ